MTEELLERGILPDGLIRWGIRRQLRKRLRDEAARTSAQSGHALTAYADTLRQQPIALHTASANEQHYEVPSAFFEIILGQHRKYSSGLWRTGTTTLDQAEANMLALTCERAEIEDGMRILDLGCGWGSLSLWIATTYPKCQVTAVSNSTTQRESIEAQCQARSITNVRVITQDVNTLELRETFDRIVSIEMLEHVRNYEQLFERIASWIAPGGAFFVHIFVHDRLAYPFEDGRHGSWMGRRFFRGGQMPANRLLYEFDKSLSIEKHWTVDGTHYARTAQAWLERLDAHASSAHVLGAGDERRGKRERNAWRVFLMACEELWGFDEGREWYVAHYLLRPNGPKLSERNSASR